MNKVKTTLKAIRNSHVFVVPVGYCQLQFLLNYRSPVAYATGTYGWNCDLYSLSPDVGICTGYRTAGNVNYPFDRIREFDNRAAKIDRLAPDCRQQFDKLIDEFVADVRAFAEANR